MKETAQGLAALGRGPDTQLVHMTPGEVKSLQQLAMANGGSLTINPATGLPEAGFLSSLLPMLIGAGITAATGGAAAPWMVGLGVGGVQAARTGSIGKGLMAGLGAYGGAGLGEAFAGAGMQAPLAPQLAQAQAGVGELASAANAAGGMAPSDYAANILSKTQPYVDASTAAKTAFANASPFERLGTMGQGVTSLGSDAGRTAFMQNIGGGMGLAKTGAMAAAPVIADQMVPTATETPAAQNQGMIRPYTYSREKIPSAFEDVAGAPYSSKERQYFTDKFTAGTPYKAPGPEYMAEGGSVGGYTYDPATGQYTGGRPLTEGAMLENALPTQYDNNSIGGYAYNPAMQTYTRATPIAPAQVVSVPTQNPGGDSSYAQGGGISDLGDYSDGGRLLRGPGDGVSDSIPAMIGKKQQARLADGEFVIPARIVSELGNGSTEAGARQLYAMMDRVQKNRKKTMGKGKVAVNSKSHKLLPA